MIILVTGPRVWYDSAKAEILLVAAATDYGHIDGDVTVRHGAAKGADDAFAEAAKYLGWDLDPMPARDFGHPLARNTAMVKKLPKPNVCVGVYLPCTKPGCIRPKPHGTHGTAHQISEARKAGIPIMGYIA